MKNKTRLAISLALLPALLLPGSCRRMDGLTDQLNNIEDDFLETLKLKSPTKKTRWKTIPFRAQASAAPFRIPKQPYSPTSRRSRWA